MILINGATAVYDTLYFISNYNSAFFVFSNSKMYAFFYTLLFHSLFKVEFDMDHFVLGEHRER